MSFAILMRSFWILEAILVGSAGSSWASETISWRIP